MKNAPGLAINTALAQGDKKYLGDPDSPNFLPDSPLIQRPVLSTQQENELKWICGFVLANVQSSDDSGTDPLSEIIQSLQAQESLPAHDTAHQNAQAPARNPAKPVASSRYLVSTRKDVPTKRAGDDTGMVAALSKPAFTDNPAGHPVSATGNDETLWTSRSRLSSRSKTGAAPCVEHTGENTDPSSRPSNRTTYTTYSTPATSIGAGGQKGHAQDEPALPALDFYGLLSQGESPLRDSAQVRAWMDEQFKHQHLHVSTRLGCPTNPLQEFDPTPRAEGAEQLPQRMKRSSIQTKVQEYFRPGSSSSNPLRRSSFASNLRNYIRPGSSAASVHSATTNTSTMSRTQEHWSSVKRKLSDASRMSQRSNHKGAIDADSTLQGETDIDLNRPLPPLPSLDSYRERKTHIASLMKKVQSSKVDWNGTGDGTSLDCQVIPNGSTPRFSNHSLPPCMDVPAAPIGSMSTNLDTQSSANQSSSSLGRLQSKPDVARGGITVTISPLSQSDLPRTELKKEGFAKRWGGRLSLVKKPKMVVAV